MARSELEVIVKVAAREAIRELQRLETELDGGQTQAKSFGLRFTELKSQLDLAVGAVRTVGQAFETAFDLAYEGAQIIQARESFDTLLESIGAAPDLLDQLTDAADGTVDQLTLMSSVATLTAGASDDVAQAMAGASPELLEIARAASKLNPSLGDTSKLFADIGTGIKRASPLILDNLGLTIKLGPAQERFAESIGKTVAELSEEEKQLAILNDVLRAGNILIEQAGGTVESTTDDFDRFTASLKNLTDEMKTRAVPAIGEFVSRSVGMLDLWAELTRLVNEGNVSQARANIIMAEVGFTSKTASEALTELNEEYDRAAFLTEEAIPATESFDRHLRFASEAMQQASIAADGWNTEVSNIQAGTSDADRATDAYSQRMQGLFDHFRTTKGAAEAFNEQLGRTVDDGARAAEVIRELETPLEDFLDTIDTDLDSPIKAFIEDLQFLAVGGAALTKEIPELLDEIADKVTEGVITPQQAEELSGKLLSGFLQAKEEAGQISFEEATRNYSDALQVPIVEARAVLESEDPIGEVQRQLDAIDASQAKQQTLEFAGELETVGSTSETMTTGVTSNLQTITSEWDAPITAAQKYVDVLNNIPANVSTNVTITGDTGGVTNGNGSGGQHGLDLTVPPGFPRDTYPVYASSGERVTVQTRAQQSQGKQGDFIIQNLNITSTATDAAGIAEDIITALGEQARLAGMSGTFALGV